MTPDERTWRALGDILGFADEISRYVTSLGEQNFYSHRARRADSDPTVVLVWDDWG